MNPYFAIFDGNNLTTSVPGLTILGINIDQPPARKLSMSQIARAHRNKVTSGFYVERNIIIRVGIVRATLEGVQQAIDSLMALIQGLERELWVPQSGETRKYIATFQDPNVLRRGGTYWEADLVFACTQIFSHATAYTEIVNQTGLTVGSRTDNYIFGGSAPIQVPFITVYYSAISGGDNAAVTIGNEDTGQQVTITRTWAVGDRIEIDSQNEFVRVNGVDVAFTGSLPAFEPGLRTLSYSDGFTTRTFNYRAYYYRRWI